MFRVLQILAFHVPGITDSSFSPSIISRDISRGSIIIILRHQNLSSISSLLFGLVHKTKCRYVLVEHFTIKKWWIKLVWTSLRMGRMSVKLTWVVRQHRKTNANAELERGFTVQHMNANWCIQHRTTSLFTWTNYARQSDESDFE